MRFLPALVACAALLTPNAANAVQSEPQCHVTTRTTYYTNDAGALYRIVSNTTRCRGQIVYGEAFAVLLP